ncbi:hypothetical protein [Devosia epidermidihirudinis]|nr:hypothetical protein [Devosia epidermidihirudinis]
MSEKTLTSKIPHAGLKYGSPFGPRLKSGRQIKAQTTGASRK